jgi:hypothetical protein
VLLNVNAGLHETLHEGRKKIIFITNQSISCYFFPVHKYKMHVNNIQVPQTGQEETIRILL